MDNNEQWLKDHEEALERRLKEVFDYYLAAVDDELKPHVLIDPLIHLVSGYKQLGRLQVINGMVVTLEDEFDRQKDGSENNIINII